LSMPMSQKLEYFVTLVLALHQLVGLTAGEAIALNPKNLSKVLNGNDLVLILFYSERCGYSMNFMPIFDAAAAQLRLAFGDNGTISLAKVDCKAYPALENRFDIGKYPTVKIVRFGRVGKSEYRGQRSLDAVIQFAHKELRDPIEEFYSMSDLQNLKLQKYLVVGYFENSNHLEYEVFRKTTLVLRDHYCRFHVIFGEAAMSLNPSGRNKIVFEKNLALAHLEISSEYKGSMSSFSEMLNWIQKKCQPIVRDLTLDNAEEISEDGRPMVILFHHKSDMKSGHQFEKVIEKELMDELDNINFVTADVDTFEFLFHIDKTEEALPIIVIDSIIHMYEFPRFEDIHTPGKLKEFIREYYTGQLHISHHREELLAEASAALGADNQNNTNKGNYATSLATEAETTTANIRHKSKLKDMLPSRNRYTFARDEL
ncbi:hypothetical protein KR044_006887, partial [Drosophila immigrans]